MKKQRFFHFTCENTYIPLAEKLLLEEGYRFSPVPFFKGGRALEFEPQPLGGSIASFFGLIYIHDKASFLPPLFLNPPKEGTVLDLCASPGGKTSILSKLVGQEGLVFANEANKKRFLTLKKNVQRLNLLNVVTLNYPGESFPYIDDGFDYILLDVPCSGWGRKEICNNIWHEGNVDFLVSLQRDLIKQAFNLLKDGGKLVYSTCTTNPKENQDQVSWATSEFEFRLEQLNEVEGFVYNKNNGYILIDGIKSGSQSFFIAMLSKQSQSCCSQFISKQKPKIREAKEKRELEKFLDLSHGFVINKKNKLFFLPHKAVNIPDHVKYNTFELGKIDKNNIALFSDIRFLHQPQSIKNFIVFTDIKELKKIITGQMLFSEDSKSNWVAIYWYNLPLGFLKKKGKRIFWTNKITFKKGTFYG